MLAHRIASALVVASFAVVALGCGGNSVKVPGSDAGNDVNSTQDSGGNPMDSSSPDVTTDAPADAGGDVLEKDAPADSPLVLVDGGDGGPNGFHLQTGDTLTLAGVTGDGFAVYTDDTANMLYAASLGGGAAQTIVATDDTTQILVSANVVFAWTALDATTNAGTLTIWTSAAGVHQISTTSSPGANAPIGAASADSSHIVYLSNSTATTTDAYGAGSDGTNPTKILTGVEFDATCAPLAGFAGAYAIASYCPAAGGDAGGATSISTFAVPAWTQANITTDSVDQNWSTDQAGVHILVFTNGSGAQVFPIGGGTATTIDSTGTFGLLTLNGQDVLYGTGAVLDRSPIVSPTPTTLVTAAAAAIDALSPSQQTLLYFINQSATTNLTDLYMASAVAASTPVTLSSMQTATVLNDAFTADSSHALFYTAYNTTTFSGTLDAIPTTANPGMPVALGQNVFSQWATSLAKVVFNDNYNATTGFADIKGVDTASAAAPTLIVDQANAPMFVSPGKNQVVYTWSVQPGALAGLYVVNAP